MLVFATRVSLTKSARQALLNCVKSTNTGKKGHDKSKRLKEILNSTSNIKQLKLQKKKEKKTLYFKRSLVTPNERTE